MGQIKNIRVKWSLSFLVIGLYHAAVAHPTVIPEYATILVGQHYRGCWLDHLVQLMLTSAFVAIAGTNN